MIWHPSQFCAEISRYVKTVKATQNITAGYRMKNNVDLQVYKIFAPRPLPEEELDNWHLALRWAQTCGWWGCIMLYLESRWKSCLMTCLWLAWAVELHKLVEMTNADSRIFVKHRLLQVQPISGYCCAGCRLVPQTTGCTQKLLLFFGYRWLSGRKSCRGGLLRCRELEMK